MFILLTANLIITYASGRSYVITCRASVCLSVYEQDCAKNSQVILMTSCTIIHCCYGKKGLHFGFDLTQKWPNGNHFSVLNGNHTVQAAYEFH